jgi:UDP-GlcNAc3NAcA epimerase
MRSIIEVLSDSGMPVVFPVHPRTEKCLQEYGSLERMPENVRLIKPLGYLDNLMLMANARKILTDSGGIQKVACMLGVPCVTLRENTEWVETLGEGGNVLVGGRGLIQGEEAWFNITHILTCTGRRSEANAATKRKKTTDARK